MGAPCAKCTLHCQDAQQFLIYGLAVNGDGGVGLVKHHHAFTVPAMHMNALVLRSTHGRQDGRVGRTQSEAEEVRGPDLQRSIRTHRVGPGGKVQAACRRRRADWRWTVTDPGSCARSCYTSASHEERSRTSAHRCGPRRSADRLALQRFVRTAKRCCRGGSTRPLGLG